MKAMKLFCLLMVMLLLSIFAIGCATVPQPPPEEMAVAIAKVVARSNIYFIAKNNLDEAINVYGYFSGVDPNKFLTYAQWLELIDTMPLPGTYKIAFYDAIDVVSAWLGPDPAGNLLPISKRIIVALIAGAMAGAEQAIQEGLATNTS